MISRCILFLIALLLWCSPAWAARRVDHVFIISFDGGKPSVMRESEMPELMSLAEHGASTWEAQTVFPSITLVAHTSMLTGLSPEKHHVNWNDWEPEHGVIQVPTVFSLAHAEKLNTAMFVGKPKFIHLYQTHALSNFSLPSYRSESVAAAAADYIKFRKPNLCFIHFADSDGAGHAYGWGSKQQEKAFADEDKALKTVILAITESGIEKSSVVIMTADHGGHDKTHGTKMPEDMTIPWVVWGAGVKEGFKIQVPVTTCDTAATALWLLDVPLPSNLDGKPVTSAFTFPPAKIRTSDTAKELQPAGAKGSDE